MKTRYKIGDRVLTRPGSDHEWQSGGEPGEIIEFADGHEQEIIDDLSVPLEKDNYYYQVKWNVSGDDNCYRFKDIMPVTGPDSDDVLGFVIGQWYKCSCNNNLYQFDGFLQDRKWGSSAEINPLDHSHGSAKPGYTKITCHEACVEYFSPTSLADMEVVNRFLPKITMEEIQQVCKEKFPTGCIYKDVEQVGTNVLKKDYTTYSIHGEHIYAHNGGGCLYKNGKYAELVSLPERAPEPPPEFKTGDWVKILDNYSGSSHKKGDIVLIDSVISQGPVSVEIAATSEKGWLYKDQIRIATHQEKRKELQNLVGRKVMCRIDKPNGGTAKKGDVGEIVNIGETNAHVHGFAHQLNYSMQLDFAKKYQLLPKGYVQTVKTTETMEAEFKVGDWVTITKSGRNWGNSMNKLDGKTVKITQVDGKDPTIRFEGSSGFAWVYSDGHFRKATLAEIAKVSVSDSSSLIVPEYAEFAHLEPYELSEDNLLYSGVAKRKYPEGTRYICPNSRDVHTIDQSRLGVYKILRGSGNIDAGCERGYLFHDGKWAEIIRGVDEKASDSPGRTLTRSQERTMREHSDLHPYVYGITELRSKIAERGYPVGTTFLCANSGIRYEIDLSIFNVYRILHDSGGDVDGGNGRGYLRYNGMWAKIVRKDGVIEDFNPTSLHYMSGIDSASDGSRSTCAIGYAVLDFTNEIPRLIPSTKKKVQFINHLAVKAVRTISIQIKKQTKTI